MSIFETPPSQRQYHSSIYTTPNVGGGPSSSGYPDLPSELRSSSRNSYTGGSSSAYATDSRSSQAFTAAPSGSESGIPQAPKPVSSTDNLGPVPRAARTINEFLTTEARYPQLDDIVSRRTPLLQIWEYGGIWANDGWYGMNRRSIVRL